MDKVIHIIPYVTTPVQPPRRGYGKTADEWFNEIMKLRTDEERNQFVLDHANDIITDYVTEREIGDTCINTFKQNVMLANEMDEWKERVIRTYMHFATDVNNLNPGDGFCWRISLLNEVCEPWDKVFIPRVISQWGSEDHCNYLDYKAIFVTSFVGRYREDELTPLSPYSAFRTPIVDLRRMLSALDLLSERNVKIFDARKAYSFSDERHKDNYSYMGKVHATLNQTMFPRIPVPVLVPIFEEEGLRLHAVEVLHLFWENAFDKAFLDWEKRYRGKKGNGKTMSKRTPNVQTRNVSHDGGSKAESIKDKAKESED